LSWSLLLLDLDMTLSKILFMAMYVPTSYLFLDDG